MKGSRKIFLVSAAVALFFTSISAPVRAAGERELLQLINEYRADPPACNGEQRSKLSPLAHEDALARVDLDDTGRLQQALKDEGFQSARAEALTVSGPPDARAAMQFIAQRNCRTLLNPAYSVAGISRDGREWKLVLAEPLLASDIGNWQQAGKQVLKHVNEARSTSRKCGNQRFDSAPALSWNDKLGAAARAHSRDMAQRNTLSHEGGDGSSVGERVKAAGYAWRHVSENVATGQGSARQVVDGWLNSPGHCQNIMNSRVTEMGAAYALNPDSSTTIFWTQVFGTPR